MDLLSPGPARITAQIEVLSLRPARNAARMDLVSSGPARIVAQIQVLSLRPTRNAARFTLRFRDLRGWNLRIFCPTSLRDIRTVGARIADHADQISPESNEDYRVGCVTNGVMKN
ncbi:hypothetical protein L3X38_017392 [Prunus dulcis]|uniref:Uncharacterized protein n=1 Tax=Prunus dulcis TaxID=3755 RepID=A0AAD4ZA04_PRUDU|nr:hypothetical protein L3X38_017392 [Prunus dulcis]